MHRRLGGWLVNGSRIGFLILIVAASAAYGLTRPSTIDGFNKVALFVFAAWVAGHMIGLKRPRTGLLPWLIVLLILTFGWGMTALSYANDWLADSEMDFPDIYFDLTAYGAYATDSAFGAMVRTSALLGLFLMAIDLYSEEPWSKALLGTLAMTAIGMVLLFYIQSAFDNIIPLRDTRGKPMSFATFRYWGNGASYLGLTWPLVAGIFVATAIRKSPGWSLWMAASLLVFGALYLNVSKAGHVLGVIGILLLAGLVLAQLGRSGFFRTIRVSPFALATVILPLIAIAISLYFVIPQKRWDSLTRIGLEKNPRYMAYPYFLRMVPDAGWLGYGPGSFAEAHHAHLENDKRIRNVFWVAHQDYLQTVIEWGYVGTALWGLLLVPAAVRLLFRGLRKSRSNHLYHDHFHYGIPDRVGAAVEAFPTASSPVIQCAAFTAVGITALHAAVDFPMQIESLQFYFLILVALGWLPRSAAEDQSGR